MEQHSAFDNFELHLNESSKSFLRETAKWANFLAIVGYVFLGLIVIMALFMGTALASLSAAGGIGGGVITIIYLAIAALYFFPIYFLQRFAANMKNAFDHNDNEALTEGFNFLKKHYKFIGILMIVMISFYVLIFFIALIGGLAAM